MPSKPAHVLVASHGGGDTLSNVAVPLSARGLFLLNNALMRAAEYPEADTLTFTFPDDTVYIAYLKPPGVKPL